MILSNIGSAESTQDHDFQEIHPQELFKASKGTKKNRNPGPRLDRSMGRIQLHAGATV